MDSIVAFLSWYLVITLFGWLTFPLVYFLFPALADHGYSLARVAGLLVWSYIFWLFTSLGLTQNTVGGILFSLLVPAGISGSILVNRRVEIILWLRQNFRVVLVVEILFLVSFGFLAFIRAGNPELDGTERPMELMFINSILRSPTFPPHDSWLSGYAISYYYFGYVMTAMLAKLSGLPGSLAHNLMTALIFGLAAVSAYGILYNLLMETDAEGSTKRRRSLTAPLLAPLFLLIVSNIEGFLEVLHARGIFWNSNPSNFWTWLGIKELSDSPTQPYQWIPDRYLWWWRASRVVSDFNLRGNFQEIIDEFPFFSFLLGDLHPHVLAIPFTLLATAIALNIFLGGWRGNIHLPGIRLHITKAGFFTAALVLGGLAFLNTWDILPAAALIVSAYVLLRVREDGWSWSRLEDVFALGLPLGFVSILLYLPFYLGFSSQANGVLPNLVNPTRGAQLWVMFAPLWVPLLAYLIYLWRGEKRTGNWLVSLLLVISLVLLLWGVSWLIGWLVFLRDPIIAQGYLASQALLNVMELFKAAITRRLIYIGGLLTLLAVLVPTLAFLIVIREPKTKMDPQLPATKTRTSIFVLLLMALGSLLVLAPEFVYLRDQFDYRINTVFKFYYQAWLLWSMTAAFGIAILLQRLRGFWEWAFRITLIVLLFLSLTYPVLSLANKTNNFDPPSGWTLDDFSRIERSNPDEAAAIQWLHLAPYGVVAEAVGPGPCGGSYTGYARISEYTGLPAVLGWVCHESQWRGGDAEQGSRRNDIAQLYTTSNWQNALAIITKYNIRYVYIGDLEASSYAVHEEKFRANLPIVFHSGNVTVYEMPQMENR